MAQPPPGYYPPPPVHYWVAPPKPPTAQTATAALICSLLWGFGVLSLAGLALAVVAWVTTSRHPHMRGAGMATAAFLLALGGLFFAVPIWRTFGGF